MSRIYFHSPSGEAELRGSERAHMGLLCNDITKGIFNAGGTFRNDLFLVTHFKPEDYQGFGSSMKFAQDFNLWLSVSWGAKFDLPDAQPLVWDVVLNTALAVGGDPLRLMARLHGQCEIHAWVDGPNRAWLAEIIEQGRASGIMRPDQGWEGVVLFLRERDDEPVVTSYSVTDGFPNAWVASVGEEEEDSEQFYELPDEKQWELAMEGLRDSGRLELRPDDWRFPGYWLGQMPHTAFSVLEAASALTPSTY